MTSQADTSTTNISNQSISPGKKAEETWANAQKKANGYYRQAHTWYTEHNTPIRVIPELTKVNQLDLGLTVLGMAITAWIAIRFCFGRD